MYPYKLADLECLQTIIRIMLVYYYGVLNSKLALTNDSLYSCFQSIKFKKNEYGSSSEELITIRICDVEKVRRSRSRNLKPNLNQYERHSSDSLDDGNKESKFYFVHVRGPLRGQYNISGKYYREHEAKPTEKLNTFIIFQDLKIFNNI